MAEQTKLTPSKPRLGRGLSSLIVNSADSAPRDEQHSSNAREPALPTGLPIEIEIEHISPNPFQPRREFRAEELNDLAQSIAQQGILQPLVLAPNGEEDASHPYILIAGERRLRAARQIGMKKVPCVVKQATRQQMLEWALIENIQRSDLNPVERARAYRDYLDRFNLSGAQAAQRLGEPRTTIANYLRILDLSDSVQTMLIDGRLTFGHAKVLAGLAGAPERQAELARQVVDDTLSVRQLETLACMEAAGCVQEAPKPARMKPAYIRDLEEQLTAAIGTHVSIHPGRAKHTGRIVIEYYNLDDFDRIALRMGVSVQG